MTEPLIFLDPFPRNEAMVYTPDAAAELDRLGRVVSHFGSRAPDDMVEQILPDVEIIVGQTAMLKERLQAPLSGMATSFSTSLFGLAGSLVLGFLDLQSGRTANRFYTEVENWLSSMTHLSAGGGVAVEGETSVPAYVQALLEQTADGLDRMQRALAESDRERRASAEQLGELNHQLSKLSELLMREARDVGDLAQAQSELRSAIKVIAANQGGGSHLSDELRAEFRLLTRTIAAAMESKNPQR